MTADANPDPIDDVAVFALNAVDADEALSIEAWLAGDPAAQALEIKLRDTTARLAEAAELPSHEPAAGLRARVLEAALGRRPGAGITAAGAAELHAIELERFVTLLSHLAPDDWQRPVDPLELRGWTIHDLAAHVTSNETLLAAHLSHPVPGVPETATLNEPRTEATQARHRARQPADTIAELDAAVRAVAAAVHDLDDDELARDIDWWGLPTSIRTALIVRAFETWTHADDTRRAVGLPHLPPPAPSLRTMGQAAVGWIPLMLVASGVELPERPIRLNLTGAGGGSYDLELGADQPVQDAGAIEPDAEITVDLVAFCRAVANRIPDDGVVYTATGDRDLARAVIDAIPALAAL